MDRLREEGGIEVGMEEGIEVGMEEGIEGGMDRQWWALKR
jgi:hypothetical protein